MKYLLACWSISKILSFESVLSKVSTQVDMGPASIGVEVQRNANGETQSTCSFICWLYKIQETVKACLFISHLYLE